MTDEKKPSEDIVEAPAITNLLRRAGITEGRAFVAGPPRVSESDREIAESLNSMIRGQYVAWAKALDNDLKDVVRRAIKMVEENPRNEAMRTPVPRPAVERMLARDLARLLPQLLPIGGVRFEQLETVAGALFDAGWRPTIERLAR